MRDEMFKRGMAILTAAFTGVTFNMALYKNRLSDLNDQDFERAILQAVDTVKEIYPGTNLIAVIREIALSEMQKRIQRTQKIQDQRCDPPPAEWNELVKSVTAGK